MQKRGISGSKIIQVAEATVYYVVGVFLLVTIVLLFGSAVKELIELGQNGLLQTSLEMLDKILLVFIFAELLNTVSTIVREGEIVASPFLLIGVIAAVRRILAITASIEQALGTPEFGSLILELGVLTALVITLSVAFYFIRRSEGVGEKG